jgi:hypothetical protein
MTYDLLEYLWTASENISRHKNLLGNFLALHNYAFRMDCCYMLVYAVMNNAVSLPAKPYYFYHLGLSLPDHGINVFERNLPEMQGGK